MKIVLSLIVMAMISTMAYAADPATSTPSAAAPTKSASAAQPPKGLKGDASATGGKVTTPAPDEITKAPASGSVPSSRLPK